MGDTTAIVVATLAVYMAVLIAIGWWASRRSGSEQDFFLGGRRLGPVVAAISYASSASSVWTLLGVSGAAYVLGISVVWIAGGSISGMLVAWFWIGPRLRAHSRDRNQLTLIDFIAEDAAGAWRSRIVVAASLITVFSFIFYVAAQFQGAGNTFASTFSLPMDVSILIGAAIIMVYTLLGGFWAVSVTDTLQGLLMAVTALVLPAAAIAEAGGFGGFVEGIRSVSSPEQLSWTGEHLGFAALGFAAGSLGIAFGTWGQPHLLVRFMALRDANALRRARLITIGWYLVVFTGMCVVGLAGHVLHRELGDSETVFFVLTESLFTPMVGAILLAAVLSAIMSTADSQLLVAASAIAHDLGLARPGSPGRRLSTVAISRLTVVALVVLAVVVALWIPDRIFSRVLFAWSALGAAFGPTVFLRLAGQRLRPDGVLASVLTGFGLAVAFHVLPATPGDFAERIVPFLCSLAVVWAARLPAERT